MGGTKIGKGISSKAASFSGLLAGMCVVLTLAVFPLAMRDRYFDINRFKVQLLLTGMAVLFPLWAISSLLCAGKPRLRANPSAGSASEERTVAAAACLFLAAWVFSSARRGFDAETVWGTQGRRSGLLFLTACTAVFFMSRRAVGIGRLMIPVRLAVLIIAGLGVLNTLGRDPFGFYTGIKKGQEDYFVSTIGNTDFFGAWLAMMYPLCTAFPAGSERRADIFLRLISAALIPMGVFASRSDCAFGAMLVILLVRLALYADGWRSLRWGALLGGLFWLALPVLGALLRIGWFDIRYKGAVRFLYRSRLALAALLLHGAAAGLFGRMARVGKRPPGQKRARRLAFVLAAGCAGIGLVLMFYFSRINRGAELGFAGEILRFGDEWGSRRGFVWRRALRAFSDFSPASRLFGGGVDAAKEILTPYFDRPSMLRYGTFNDAHNQVLQYLLTTGITGLLSLAALHLSLLRLLFERAEQSGTAAEYAAAFAGYTLVSMLSVSQPVLLASYACLAGLALASSRKENAEYESGSVAYQAQK